MSPDPSLVYLQLKPRPSSVAACVDAVLAMSANSMADVELVGLGNTDHYISVTFSIKIESPARPTLSDIDGLMLAHDIFQRLFQFTPTYSSEPVAADREHAAQYLSSILLRSSMEQDAIPATSDLVDSGDAEEMVSIVSEILEGSILDSKVSA